MPFKLPVHYIRPAVHPFIHHVNILIPLRPAHLNLNLAPDLKRPRPYIIKKFIARKIYIYKIAHELYKSFPVFVALHKPREQAAVAPVIQARA
jgi:hypothetical protein